MVETLELSLFLSKKHRVSKDDKHKVMNELLKELSEHKYFGSDHTRDGIYCEYDKNIKLFVIQAYIKISIGPDTIAYCAPRKYTQEELEEIKKEMIENGSSKCMIHDEIYTCVNHGTRLNSNKRYVSMNPIFDINDITYEPYDEYEDKRINDMIAEYDNLTKKE